jgi:hypothetical protein
MQQSDKSSMNYLYSGYLQPVGELLPESKSDWATEKLKNCQRQASRAKPVNHTTLGRFKLVRQFFYAN